MMVDSIWCVGVHCDLFPPSSTPTVPKVIYFLLVIVLHGLNFYASLPPEMMHLKWFLVCSKHLIPRKISTHQRDF